MAATPWWQALKIRQEIVSSGGQIDDVQDRIEEYRRRVVDGEIEVPTVP